MDSPPRGWKPPINTREGKQNPRSNGGGEVVIENSVTDREDQDWH
jgi:hypothetical protein